MIVYDSIKHGLRTVPKKAADAPHPAQSIASPVEGNVTPETSAEGRKLMEDMLQHARADQDRMAKTVDALIAHTVKNNDQFASQAERLLRSHADVARLLYEVLKQMHGME